MFLGEAYDETEMHKLISGIKQGNYNKWKSTMTRYQVKLFESAAANTLKRFGYETSYEEKAVSEFTAAVYRFHEACMKIKFLFKINVIDGIKIRFMGKEPFAE